MAFDANIRGLTGTQAGVDSNNNLTVNLPTTPLQAGSAQVSFTRDSSTARIGRVTEEGDQYISQKLVLFKNSFNNPIATTPMSSQWSAEATTMALASQAGFYRFNSGAVTTATTGIQMHSWRTFNVEDGAPLSGRFYLRHTNGSVANKQIDIGFGYANPATGQGSATNEFIGFRWTTAGALQGVLEYSTGGAPTSLTVNINAGVPLSDNVARTYEVLMCDDVVEFWINNVFQGQIAAPLDNPGILKACGYPIFMRLFNSGSAPASAPVLDVGDISVVRIGPGADIPQPIRQVLHGRHCIYPQTGLTATDGATAAQLASGTAPTATAGSNTAAAVSGLGGWFRNTLTGVTTTVHTNIVCTDYVNPAVPTAAGAGNDVRNLVLTDIMIPPCPVSVAFTGGGFVAQWFIAIGSSALSLATATANGTTAPATKAPRVIPLPIIDTYAATAAAGAMPTRAGDNSVHFNTPLVVHPGEHVTVGFRTIFVTAAVTAGAIDGGIGFSGYWD